MTVPVVWVSYRKPEIISRGTWDTGLLERLVDRTLWHPAGAVEYRNFDGFDNVPAAEGVVVVIGAQHHTSPGHVARLNADLARFAWVVLILAGDECSQFPWRELRHPNMRLWVMTPHPERHAGCPARFIGEGWRYDTPEVLAGFASEAEERPQDWFFAGQVTHQRRERLAAALRRVAGTGRLVESPGFTQGLERHEYLRQLAAAKVAPCPAGACTPDSFRLYEALEAGTLPLLDDTSPQGWSGFWRTMGAEATPPCPVVADWTGAADVIADELDHWPANANRAFAWWQGYKRRLTYALDDDVRAVSGIEPTTDGLADLVTVLIPTSPIPSHPGVGVIAETIESVRVRLAGCEVVVMIDGVRAEQEHRRADYEEYQRRLLRLTNLLPNVVPVRFEDHAHQAEMTRRVLADIVRTPLVLFVEHDTPLVGDVPWADLARVILKGTADVIRLSFEAQILAEHLYLMADKRPVDVNGVPLQRTGQWSQRPHLASASWYRWLLDGHLFGPGTRTMIEDRFYGECATPLAERGEWGGYCKLWMYTPPGDIKRSTHLDGRASEDKYEMTW